ncbi:MAG: RNHCP domain-containing protein [Thermomicrobiales bacterium]
MRYRDIENIREYEDHDDTYRDDRRPRGHRRRRDHRERGARGGAKPFRADGQESFKCGHCKAFIGPTVSGGRHRNHCPLCLYSRHVDGSTPGDRASDCRSLMAPVGTFHRPKGEQAIVHRCLGCGLERHCRVAADDNIVACLHLPLVPPRTGSVEVVVKEDEAAIA